MSGGRRVALAVAAAAAVFLAGCESREDKAERFYQSALQLLEQGDEERALVELRNVFQNDGFHAEARLLYADLSLQQGDEGEAYSHYLLLAEQQPDMVGVRRTLAEIAIAQGDWEEADRHGSEALRLLPEDPRIRAIALALRYRDATLARDEGAREEVSREARILLAQHGELQVARRIVIDRLLSGPSPGSALPEIERALEIEPESLEFNFARLRLLVLLQDDEGTDAQLRTMFERFPQNEEVQQALVRWMLHRGDLEGAEDLLRELAGDDASPPEGHLVVVQFLQETKGLEAAQAELGRLAQGNPESSNGDLYAALSAGIDFEMGKRDQAIEAVEAILADAEPSDVTRRIKTALARMLAMTGEAVGARARVEEVLAEDASHVEALKLRATWAIQQDRPGDAIMDLRNALSQQPEDVEAQTLLAEAHLRDGSPELAGERLAAAVQASGSAKAPSMRYASFLISQGNEVAARTVLEDARQANPGDVELAVRLAELWLEAGEDARAEGIVAELEALGTSESREAADRLDAAILLAGGRDDLAIEALAERASEEDSTVEDVAAAVQAMFDAGQVERSRVFLDDQAAKRPEDPALRLLRARLRATQGQTDEAEAILRDLVEADPSAEQPVADLYALLRSDQRPDEATALLTAAIEAQPGSRHLRWLRAGELEMDGDIAGALAIYEELYEENTSDVIVANNLASLLSQQAATPEEIERAFAIARRLRTVDEPPFQDTYGWLLYQRGEFEEALGYLEPAAEGLPDDPIVQVHLGMTYLALGRQEEAKAVLSRAVELAGDRDIQQIDLARDALAEIEARPTTDGAAAPAVGSVTPDGGSESGEGAAP